MLDLLFSPFIGDDDDDEITPDLDEVSDDDLGDEKNDFEEEGDNDLSTVGDEDDF